MTPNPNPYTYFTLPNALRVVHIHRDSTVDYCGVAVRAGSRNDGPTETYGLAHFVEHTIFKGTAKRRSWHIINRMEAVGGELNAYTSEEATLIYSIYPQGYTPRAVELLADLIFNSQFPPHQLDREREVIIDEIDSYLDSPAESIFDDFNELIFAGSPLGHNILGTVESVRNIDSAHCTGFIRHYYTPANMVFFYQGAMSADTLHTLLLRHFNTPVTAPQPARQSAPGQVEPFDIIRNADTHQAHTVMGTRTGSMFSPERPALLLLNNIIGGPGMNSLLNVALRERHGYVYSVDSAMTMFSDTGLFTIYFGCDPSNTNRCRRLAQNVVNRLADTTLTQRALDAAKKQFIGQLCVAGDNFEQTALGAARATLFRGHATLATHTRDAINAVTPEQLRQAAQSLSSLSTLTITP